MKTIKKIGSLACVSAAVLSQGQAAEPSKSSKSATPGKPNIIYIMSDDHASAAISAYGSILKDVLPTPNIDRIGREGVRMNHTYCTNSISTPSRACIITGQYSFKNGVYTLNDDIDPQSKTLPMYMKQAGYQTAMVGKWHLGTEPQYFDYYNVLPGQGVYHNPVLIEKGKWDGTNFKKAKGKTHEGHSTDVITDQALNWIQGRDPNRPFFVMCHFKAPHRSWQPAERFKKLFEGENIPEPANLLDNYDGKGEYKDHLRMSMEDFTKTDLKVDIPTNMTRDEKRHWAYQLYMKDYLRCIAGVDENVGRLLKYLDDNGLTDNTIVIYTSDQGFFLGEHGWFDKRLMFEECTKMPFLMRYPKAIKPGRENDDILLNIDFAPTLLDYAGVEKPIQMQGESFRANVEGKTPKDWRKSYYYRYWMHDDVNHFVPGHFGIRNDRYKLIFFYNQPLGMSGAGPATYTPNWEFYDTKSDPSEMKNLYNDPKYAKIISSMKQELKQLREKYGDTDAAYPQMQEIFKRYWN